MTATDELRRLLDERGVEWMPVAWNPKRETFYHAANGVDICADEYGDGLKFYTDTSATPAQAVDATLGRGECQETNVYEFFRGCSKCGYVWEYMYGVGKGVRPNYCPNCGRQVIGG